MNNEIVAFTGRQSRSEFVAVRFEKYLVGSILDVGCFEAPLRTLLSGCKYIGIDVAGLPDIQLNLDSGEKLPFDDAEFDCSLCIEVLEHLDNLHFVFTELVRVSSRYVLVSLPNCWRDARVKIEKGEGDFLHYGLPFEKPLDRHKWFFNVQQAQGFFEYQATKHNLKIVESFLTEKPKFPLIRFFRKLRFPGNKYDNRYANTAWVVFEKK